jgi:predicted RNA-binding protein
VGVTHGDAEIAPEDEVVLHHNGVFKGVGRAMAPGIEMGRMKKGACVGVRHHVGQGEKKSKKGGE